MIDPRFYVPLGPLTLEVLAHAGGGELADPAQAGREIQSCAPLDSAGPDELAFCERQRGDGPISTKAAACWVRSDHVARLPAGVAAIVARTPRGCFARSAARLFTLRTHPADAGWIHPTASIAKDVHLSPGVVVGPDAVIESGTTLGPGTVIGPGVTIGSDCRIGSNVTISCALIGHRVQIASGTVIGEAGFGVAGTAQGPVDVPQFGRVILNDEVSIGSLCAVDRGAFGDTVIGPATKIDNFTQIAHNVQVGRGVVIAAFGGISGSAVVGDFVQMGGRVGVADHLTIGPGARIGAGSGVRDDVPAKANWVGYPAKLRSQFVKEMVALRRLADGMKNQDEETSR